MWNPKLYDAPAIEDFDILVLAEEYKMSESEFRERFTEDEISRIWLLKMGRNKADRLRNPDLYKDD